MPTRWETPMTNPCPAVPRRRVRFTTRGAVLLVAGLVAAETEGAANALPSDVGVTATVNSDGSYQIRTQQPANWTFGGTVGHAVTGRRDTTGSDAIGQYREVSFDYTYGVSRSASIRVYQQS